MSGFHDRRFAGYTSAQLLGLTVLLVGGWFFLGLLSNTTIAILVLALYFAVGGASFTFLYGSIGVFSVVQPAFLAMGGYTGVYLANNHGLSPWLALPVAIAFAGVFALPIAIATVRAGSGTVLAALVTLIIALAIPPIVTSFDSLGGAVGLYANVIQQPGFWDMQFVSPLPFARIFLVLNVAVIAFMMWWKRSRFGYFTTAIKDSPLASEAAGIATSRIRVGTMVVSAMVAAPAGLVYAQYNLLATPDLFLGPTVLFQVVVIALAGGTARVWGPMVGAVVIVYLSREVSNLADGRPGVGPLTFAVVFALLAFAMPTGLSGAWEALARRRERRAAGIDRPTVDGAVTGGSPQTSRLRSREQVDPA